MTISKSSAEFAVPNGGSPYTPFSALSDGEILHIPTGIKITMDEMLRDIASSRVIYVAETHDNMESHKVQLKVIKSLYELFPGEITVGMEMLRKPAQKKIDEWIEGTLSEKDFIALWRENWGEGFDNYKAIATFIKENKIPLIALKSSKEIEHALRSKGIDGLSEEEKKLIPEIDREDKYHKIFADSIFSSHGTNSHVVLNKPYNTLLLWEETMAETIANFLTAPNFAGKKMIVLTGSFHVEYGFGIPKRTFRRVPHSYKTILPKVTNIPLDLKPGTLMQVKPTFIPLYLGDYAWNIQYKVLPANKIMLGVTLKIEEENLNIISVKDHSNAAAAGVMPGDIIISMDNKKFNSIYELKDYLNTKKIGDHSNITLLRENKEIIIEIKYIY